MKTSEKALRKFWTDPLYHQLVNTMTAGLELTEKGQTWTPEELLNAVELAVQKLAFRRLQCETNLVIPHGEDAKCARCGCAPSAPCKIEGVGPCSWVIPGRLCSSCATPEEFSGYMDRIMSLELSDDLTGLSEALETLEGCPGAGQCHGPMTWCDICGDVSDSCGPDSCDVHGTTTRGG